MTISQTGGQYKNQAELARRDRFLGEALDDLASQTQTIRNQANLGVMGSPAPPSTPAKLSVSVSNGIIQAVITHPNAPTGTNYRIEYSTTPNFLNPIAVDLGEVPVFHASLPAQKLYFRAAAKFSASELTPFIYFGSQTSPTLVAS